jgi:hypothetical protein
MTQRFEFAFFYPTIENRLIYNQIRSSRQKLLTDHVNQLAKPRINDTGNGKTFDKSG